jgi:hypothetical protein
MEHCGTHALEDAAFATSDRTDDRGKVAARDLKVEVVDGKRLLCRLVRFLLSLVVVLATLLVLLLATGLATLAATPTRASLWGHILLGRRPLERGVIRTDSNRQPWVNVVRAL